MIARLFRTFVLLLAFSGFACETIAQESCANGTCTQPATQQDPTYPRPVLGWTIGDGSAIGFHSTYEQAGAALCLLYGPTATPSGYTPAYGSYDFQVGVTCSGGGGQSVYKQYGGCGSDQIDSATMCRRASPLYQCPSNGGWTLNGSNCSRPDCAAQGKERDSTGVCVAMCQPGEFRDTNGVCQKDCTSKAGQATPSSHYTGNMNYKSSLNGCQIDCKKILGINIVAGGSFNQPQLGAQSADLTNCTYTGKTAQSGEPEVTAAAPPNPNIPQTPRDCAAKGMGYIASSSGTLTCVSQGDSPPENKPVIKEKQEKATGTPGADGQPDATAADYGKTTTESSTDTGTGKTQSTTTEQKKPVDSNGTATCPDGFTLKGEWCEKVTVTTQETAGFCKENPTAAACKGTDNSKDECVENPKRLGCAEYGDAPEGDEMETRDNNAGQLTPVVLAGSETCPADVPLPKGMTFSWASVCTGASAVKPWVLIGAWLSAILIVMGLGGRSNPA